MKAERVADNTVLGERFRIVKFLGAGSFGEVYWARQLAFGHPMRDVALKLFSPELANAKDYFDTFSDAVTLVRLLESGPPDEVSQRMVHVYDVGVLPVPAADDTVIERPFMSMKLIEGGLTIGEYDVDLARVTMPVLNIFAEQDHLVPPAASRALREVVGSKDYTELSFKGGHIGIYVSGRAQREVPPAIDQWLKQRRR